MALPTPIVRRGICAIKVELTLLIFEIELRVLKLDVVL